MLERYGVEFAQQNQEIKNKTKETNRERNGIGSWEYWEEEK